MHSLEEKRDLSLLETFLGSHESLAPEDYKAMLTASYVHAQGGDLEALKAIGDYFDGLIEGSPYASYFEAILDNLAQVIKQEETKPSGEQYFCW